MIGIPTVSTYTNTSKTIHSGQSERKDKPSTPKVAQEACPLCGIIMATTSIVKHLRRRHAPAGAPLHKNEKADYSAIPPQLPTIAPTQTRIATPSTRTTGSHGKVFGRHPSFHNAGSMLHAPRPSVPIKSFAPGPVRKRKKSLQIKQCTICGATIRANCMVQHMASHKAVPILPKQQSLFPETGSQCPICGCALKPSRAARHLKRVHQSHVDGSDGTSPVIGGSSNRRTLQKGQLSAKSGSAESVSSTTQGGSPADVNFERRLDGSRDSWKIRENGRFGSHSSYDQMDDESEP